MRFAKLIAGAAALVSTLPMTTSPADAGRRRAENLSEGYVVAYSRFGNGSITGAVRNTDLGPQVRLPSGHWEYCRRSCSETLRVQSIDFHQGDDVYLGKGTLGNECGIFGCLDIGF